MGRMTKTRRDLGASTFLVAALAALGASLVSRSAEAAPPPSDGSANEPATQATPTPDPRAAWDARYEAARKRLVGGDYRGAAIDFRALAATAPSEGDRLLALEMVRIAQQWARHEELATPPAEVAAPSGRLLRTTDELSVLYASAFLYGAGTGGWFLLQTQPDSAVTATLPFAAITAAPVVSLALVDGYYPLPRGLPQGISTGLYLGLGEGIWVSAYQHARAHRTDANVPTSSRWQGDTVASVLEVTSTLGAVTGGALSLGVPTTPGRISFVGSTTVWSGLIAGFATSAVLPLTSHRTEDSVLVGGLGYNAGMAYGMLFASKISPSVTRVRLVDLSGAAGGLVATGFYLSVAHQDANPRVTLGVAAGGAALGLAVGTFLTDGMKKQYPEVVRPSAITSWQPTLTPVQGGAVLGLGGTL